MRRVVLESPYGGDVAGNVAYARRCIVDCLKNGEAPIASHLLFTQPGILDDTVVAERALGINAGLAWHQVADAIVFYMDRGMSNGMQAAENYAKFCGAVIERRWLGSGDLTWPIGTDDRQNVQAWERELHMPLDAEIAPAVRVLVNAGVETFESCSGCEGHCFPEPTVRFHGGQAEGFRVLGIALQHGLKVTALRRYWSIQDGEPHGPHWEITF